MYQFTCKYHIFMNNVRLISCQTARRKTCAWERRLGEVDLHVFIVSIFWSSTLFVKNSIVHSLWYVEDEREIAFCAYFSKGFLSKGVEVGTCSFGSIQASCPKRSFCREILWPPTKPPVLMLKPRHRRTIWRNINRFWNAFKSQKTIVRLDFAPENAHVQ